MFFECFDKDLDSSAIKKTIICNFSSAYDDEYPYQIELEMLDFSSVRAKFKTKEEREEVLNLLIKFYNAG